MGMASFGPGVRRKILFCCIAAAVVGGIVAAVRLEDRGTPGFKGIELAQKAEVGTASFSAAPVSGPAPLLVNFQASPGVSATIDFGDGDSGMMVQAPTCAQCPTLSVASHTYQNQGSYTATLGSAAAPLATRLITVGPRP